MELVKAAGVDENAGGVVPANDRELCNSKDLGSEQLVYSGVFLITLGFGQVDASTCHSQERRDVCSDYTFRGDRVESSGNSWVPTFHKARRNGRRGQRGWSRPCSTKKPVDSPLNG
jgi:hypothetical protein